MEKLEKSGLTASLKRRMRGDLIETFKIMQFLIMVNIFLIFLLKVEIYGQDRIQILSLLFANRILYFWNILPNRIKERNCWKHFNIKLDDFRKNGMKKNPRGQFLELLDKLTELDLYIDIVLVLILYQ